MRYAFSSFCQVFHPFAFLLPAILLGGCKAAQAVDPDTTVQTIAFASCARVDQPQQVWQSILDTDPDLFLFIGDNVYVDIPRPPKGVEDFERTYQAFTDNQPGWNTLREQVPVLATWDDHDYGFNDAGVEFPLKKIAQQQFIDFFDLPADSPVRQREGVYDAHLFGPKGKRVQVILLDTRTFRDALVKNPRGRVNGLGPYLPRADGKGSMLGQAQWAWLAQELKKPAEVRIIASSIQVIADEHRWETWGNLPHERERLFSLIEATRANGVFFISGDRHLTEISRDVGKGTPYPMWDFTNSGMKEADRPVREPNSHRVGKVYRRSNFGLIQIDWGATQPSILYKSLDEQGGVLLQQAVPLKELIAVARP